MIPTDARLRALDVAPDTLTAAEEQQARQVLTRILATDPHQTPRRAPRRVTPLRVGAVAAAGALIATVGLVADAVLGGRPAYASWSAEPSEVAAVDLAAATRACLDAQEGHGFETDQGRLVIAERRGENVMLLYRTEVPDVSGACLVRVLPGSGRVSHLDAAAGGSDGPAMVAPAGQFLPGSIAQFGGGQASVTDGAAGEGVVGVTIHAGDLTVEASVQDGRYSAWWPGPAFEDVRPPSGEGGPEDLLTYDLLLDDGTVVRDADPAWVR